jgi:hypothetical protein
LLQAKHLLSKLSTIIETKQKEIWYKNEENFWIDL